MYVLDTDILTELAKRTPNRHLTAWRKRTSPDLLFLSICTIMEVRKGIERARENGATDSKIAQIEKNWQPVLDGFRGQILDATQDVAANWAFQLRRNDKHFADKLIAATAIHHGFTVITNNDKDFSKFGVQFLNPMKAGK